MTGAILVAIYLVALALFLGLDIISKVPASLYALVLSALGALAAVSVVAGFLIVGPQSTGITAVLGRIAVGLAAVSAVAGTVALGRLLGAFNLKKKSHTS